MTPPLPQQATDRKLHRPLRWLGLGAGLLLLVIGIRFIAYPTAAQRTFGLPRQLAGTELHAIIGLRDIWLAGLALAFAGLRQWKALALWLLMGAAVCAADGFIVLKAGGKPWALAFHWSCGIVCLLAGARCWRLSADSS